DQPAPGRASKVGPQSPPALGGEGSARGKTLRTRIVLNRRRRLSIISETAEARRLSHRFRSELTFVDLVRSTVVRRHLLGVQLRIMTNGTQIAVDRDTGRHSDVAAPHRRDGISP